MEILLTFILDALLSPLIGAIEDIDTPVKAFVVGSVLLIIAVWALMGFHYSVRLVVLPLLCLGLCQCSTQVITRTDGTRIVNNNLFAAGTLHIPRDGEILMTGTSEKAGEQLAKHLKMAAMIGLAGQGVEAVKDMGIKAVDKFAK